MYSLVSGHYRVHMTFRCCCGRTLAIVTFLSINSGTGLISGRPTVLALYSVTVTETAASGANPGSTTFSWRVRRASRQT